MAGKIAKITSMAVACAMCITAFTGCTGSKTDKSANKTDTSAQTGQNQEPITFDWLVTTTVPDENSEIVKMVEKKFNVKFNYFYVDDQNYNDALSVKLAAGEMPDSIKIRNTALMDKYVKMGVLGEVPIDKIRKLAPAYASRVEKLDPTGNMWNVTMVDGKNYGYSNFNINNTYPSVNMIRTDWLKNVGINKMPETLTELENALYKFRNEDPDKNGKKDTYGISNTALPSIWGAYGLLAPVNLGNKAPGVSRMLKDGKIIFPAILPEAKDCLALFAKWYKDGVIDPEFITGENTGGYWALSQAFMNNRIGITGTVAYYHYSPPNTAGGVSGGPCYVEMKKVNPNATFDISKLPVGPTGKSGTPYNGVLGETSAFTSKLVKDERKLETFMKMMDTCYTDEEYDTIIAYGYKDVDYKFDDATKNIAFIDNNPTNVRKKGIMVFGETDPLLLKKLQPGTFDYADKYAKNDGYLKPIVPSTDVYSKNIETLNKIASEAYIKIVTGEKPINYFDEFVTQFKANGGTEVEKSMTDAYNKMLGK